MMQRELTAAEATARVAKGFEELGTDMLKALDGDSIDIASFANCVGGQLAEAKNVDLFVDVMGCDAARGIAAGFDLSYEDATPENYTVLTAAWKRGLSAL
jgi:hypothetical protein